MNKFSFFALVLIMNLSSVSLRAVPLSEPVAKVEAFACDTGKVLRETSGLLFENKGQTFLLTSYFLISGLSSSNCFRFRVAGQMQEAKIFKADWSRDALVLSSSQHLAGVKTLSELIEGGAFLEKTVTLVGYLSEDQALASYEFTVLSSKTKRFNIPALASAIEVEGQPIDEGFVGSIAFGKKGNWLGMTSREYLKMVPGTSTYPMEWKTGSQESQQSLILIPAVFLSSWLNQVLENPDSITSMAVEISPGVFSSGELRFELSCPNPDDPESPVGPIGGAEGVGVGGETKSLPFCKALVSAETSVQTPWPFPSKMPWVQKTKALLEQEPKLKLRYFTNRNLNGILFRVPFWSVGGLLKNFSMADYTPVTWSEKGNEKKQIRMLAERGLELTRALYPMQTFTLEVPLLLRELYFQFQVMASEESHDSYLKSDLTWVCDPEGAYRWAWMQLKQYGKEQTGELLSVLNQLPPLLENN